MNEDYVDKLDGSVIEPRESNIDDYSSIPKDESE